MKVLLAYLCNYNERKDHFVSLLPSGLVSLASFLETNGFDVTLANFSSAGYGKGVKYIEREDPDILCLSLFSYNRTDTLKLVSKVKKQMPHLKIVLGGHHAAFLADKLIALYGEIDFIVKGEGEMALLKLLRAIKNVGDTPRIIEGERIDKLDELPFGASFSGRTYGINWNEQGKFLITSRGCPSRCTFCSSPSFWERKVRFRSPENILSEIEYIHRKYGIIYFSIRDDNFTLRKSRVIRFSRLLRKNGLYIMWNCQARVDTVDEEMLVEMKRSGLEHIQYGVESGSEKILQKYDKSITIKDILNVSEITRKAGIYLSIYLMTGMIGEKSSDVKKTISLIRKILPSDGIVSPAAYYPGTALYEMMKKKGAVDDSIWFKNRDPGIFVRNDPDVKRDMVLLLDELNKIRARAWYREKEFKKHREVAGNDCWVTDILEGDYYLHDDRFNEAESMFGKVIDNFPENIWGYLRMGKLNFLTGRYGEAVNYYMAALKLVPNFYGLYLKLAELNIILGRKNEAEKYINEAFKRNSFDKRITNFKKNLI